MLQKLLDLIYKTYPTNGTYKHNITKEGDTYCFNIYVDDLEGWHYLMIDEHEFNVKPEILLQEFTDYVDGLRK